VRDVEKLRERYGATRFDFYSPEEVWALIRAAASEQDGAIFLTAAYTGLRRGELIALRWRDVDFDRSAVRVAGSYANGNLTAPKSGHGRAVPMVPEVAETLARLSHRAEFVGDDDLVFVGEVGGYLDGSALRRRFLAACGRAGLRPIRFHDLRHTFGTLAVRGAESIVELQHWRRCVRRCGTRTTEYSWARRSGWPLPSGSRQRLRLAAPLRKRSHGRWSEP
jgi:integrase